MVFLLHLFELMQRWVVRTVQGVHRSRWQPAQGLVEYGLILVLIAIFAVGAMTVVGSRISTTFHKVDCGLRDAQMGRVDC